MYNQSFDAKYDHLDKDVVISSSLGLQTLSFCSLRSTWTEEGGATGKLP